MNQKVDLRELAVDRVNKEPVTRSSRHWISRYLLPAVILAGFVALVAWAARESFLPARQVTVVPVIATRAEIQQSGAPLFLAAGWIEPRPTPVLATALAEGVIDQLLVVEGQEVKAGEAVAKLVDADARIALSLAEADLREKEALADTLLAQIETELVYLPFQVQAAEAQQRLMRLDYQGKKSSEGSIPAITIIRAESELATATAKWEELKVRKQRREREVESLRKMREASRQGRDWQPENGQPLTDIEAGMKSALTRIAQAQAAVQTARLRLERMTVRAPISGRVLALIAKPGSRLMGQAQHAMQEASTVVSLYDPHLLQVRADVRFEDLPNFQPGQPVRIDSPALPGRPVDGEALFATSIADIQKNTLQVKVAIKDPPPVLKPDMLVQVTFVAPARPADVQPASTETLRLLVPRQLVESNEGGTRVWIADQAAGVARPRSIKLGSLVSAELVEVIDGLDAADKLIVSGREGITDGQRIKVTGEDASLGTAPGQMGNKPAKLQRLPAAGVGHQGKH
jgi:RND family efflux transporter MFP subunit